MIKRVSNFKAKNVKRWIPFFSQTGTEIWNIIETLGVLPEKIITNIPFEDSERINSKLFAKFSDRIIFLEKKPSVEEYITAIGLPKGTLCTLHGWLRIIPKEVCNRYKFYNGHPGLITKYPDLKGKDPQMRAYLGNYATSGCVLHKVSPEVDNGPILFEKEVLIDRLDVDRYFDILSYASFELWINFFNSIEWSKE